MDILDLEFLQDKKDVVLSNWLTSNTVVSMFNKNDINMEYFKERFANELIDYILTLDNKKGIMELINYLVDKKISYSQLLEIISTLKSILFEILLFSQGSIREDLVVKFYREIPEMTDKILSEFIHMYVESKKSDVQSILDNYKLAVNVSNIVSIADTKGIITYVNEEFCRISGYSKEELIGQPHNIVRHKETPSSVFKDMWNTIQSKEIWKGRVKNKTKSGGYYIVDATVVPILDTHKRIVEYLSIRKDVTDYFVQCDTLKDYKMAVDVANIVSITDPSGKIKYVNDAFCAISGYSKEELVGQPHNMVRHPEMPKEAFADLWHTIQRGQVWQGRVKNLKKNGDFYVVDATIVPIKDHSGKILEYISIRKDITELERQKEEIARIKAHQMNEDVDKAISIGVSKVFCMIPLPTIIIDEQDTIIEANESFVDLFNIFEFEELNTKIKNHNAKICDVCKNFDFHSSWKDTLDMFDYDFTIELNNNDEAEYKMKIKKSEEDDTYMIIFYS